MAIELAFSGGLTGKNLFFNNWPRFRRYWAYNVMSCGFQMEMEKS